MQHNRVKHLFWKRILTVILVSPVKCNVVAALRAGDKESGVGGDRGEDAFDVLLFVDELDIRYKLIVAIFDASLGIIYTTYEISDRFRTLRLYLLLPIINSR